MKKFLMVTTVATMVENFLLPDIKMLQEKGYEVHVACNFEKGCPCRSERIQQIKQIFDDLKIKYFQIDISRDITNIHDNIAAYKQLSDLIKENEYEMVHCHSPIGGALTRLVCRKVRKKGTKVLYTAHGFHFYKGASLKNWLIFFPAEVLCSFFTDVLITINQEDYNLAKKRMYAKHIEYIPGVGVDLSKFQNVKVDKVAKRKELGVPENASLLFSTGELNTNKNQELIIRAIENMKDVYYMIAGDGELIEYSKKLVEELGISERVLFLGYRTDVPELCRAADVFVLPSLREGLNVSTMEAMASGLPCAVSKIRGNTDLIDENGGALFDPYSVESCKDAINKLLNADRNKMGMYNAEKIKNFSTEKVRAIMSEIYKI